MTIYTGSDPIAYVVSKNQYRRHLTSSQRAMIATEIEAEYAKLAKGRQGARNDISQKFDESQKGRADEQAAKQLSTIAYPKYLFT